MPDLNDRSHNAQQDAPSRDQTSAATDPRRYHVEEQWDHIFSDGSQRNVRFVIDVATGATVAMHLLHGVHGWTPASREAQADVEESLRDNNLYDDIKKTLAGLAADFASPEQLVTELPEWAQAA